MPLGKHTVVRITSLKKEGVIVGIARTGVYAVAVGSLVIECAEKDLAPLRKQTAEEPRSPRKPKRKTVTKSGGRVFSVDLHGMTVEEALGAVQRAVDRALSADADRLDIVHGVGSGKLRSAVHRYLASLGVVKHHKLADGNPGATWAFF